MALGSWHCRVTKTFFSTFFNLMCLPSFFFSFLTWIDSCLFLPTNISSHHQPCLFLLWLSSLSQLFSSLILAILTIFSILGLNQFDFQPSCLASYSYIRNEETGMSPFRKNDSCNSSSRVQFHSPHRLFYSLTGGRLSYLTVNNL